MAVATPLASVPRRISLVWLFPVVLLGLAMACIFCSFLLDLTCVLNFSRQIWFQRLLGVFVPLVFFTGGVGHPLEGVSYWKLTYPVNVPWTMVTDGHLRLCMEPSDLPSPLPQISQKCPLNREIMTDFRHQAAQAAKERSLAVERINELNTAVGEAVMNAVVHGGGGEAEVCADEDAVQAWIKDRGTGIQMTELPRATLELGYSTKNSLGHGFWLMLRAADTIHLLTGASGITLVIPLAQQPAALPGFSL